MATLSTPGPNASKGVQQTPLITPLHANTTSAKEEQTTMKPPGADEQAMRQTTKEEQAREAWAAISKPVRSI